MDKLNFPLATYRNSTDAAVAQIAQEIEAGGNPRGDYGPFEDRRRIRKQYVEGTLDLTLYPAFDATAAPAAPSAPRRNRPAANTTAAPTAAAATLPGSNNASGTAVAEEYYDSEYSSVSYLIEVPPSFSVCFTKKDFFPVSALFFLSFFQDEDYESEYDSEGDNDNPTHQVDISNALLCTEEEAEILKWLEEQVTVTLLLKILLLF